MPSVQCTNYRQAHSLASMPSFETIAVARPPGRAAAPAYASFESSFRLSSTGMFGAVPL
jgi:hypothetical protein